MKKVSCRAIALGEIRTNKAFDQAEEALSLTIDEQFSQEHPLQTLSLMLGASYSEFALHQYKQQPSVSECGQIKHSILNEDPNLDGKQIVKQALGEYDLTDLLDSTLQVLDSATRASMSEVKKQAYHHSDLKHERKMDYIKKISQDVHAYTKDMLRQATDTNTGLSPHGAIRAAITPICTNSNAFGVDRNTMTLILLGIARELMTEEKESKKHSSPFSDGLSEIMR
jgi:hypothetical protein